MIALANEYIHKLLGNNAPAATRLADRAVKAASDLSNSQKFRLQAWVDEADVGEREGRIKAADAILKCAQTASRDLELNSMKLTSLPDVLGELTQVTRLLAGGNSFRHLPDSLSGMDNIHTLKLEGNNLVKLPSTLGKVGSFHNCDIYLSHNPIPDSEISELRKNANLRVICVPRLSYGEVHSMGIKKLVAYWFTLADLSLPDSVGQMLEKMGSDQAETLLIHLSKLVRTRDYQEVEKSVVLARRVVDVLEEMSGDDGVRDACMAASQEAVSTCTDRAMLGLNEMEKAVQFAKVSKTGDLAQLVELGAGYEKLEKIKQIAEKRCQELRLLSQNGSSGEPDDVEVYLAFMLGLAERLQLPIARNQGMLDRCFYDVSDKDINEAGDAIEKDLHDHPEQEIEALLAWQPLKEKMEQQYFGYVDDIRGEYLEKREALDSRAPDYDEQAARVDGEMNKAIDSFYSDAVKKLRSGNPLPPRTQEQAQSDGEVDTDALGLVRERMAAMMELRQRRGDADHTDV